MPPIEEKAMPDIEEALRRALHGYARVMNKRGIVEPCGGGYRVVFFIDQAKAEQIRQNLIERAATGKSVFF